MASRKLKMHKLVGRLKGFIPNINDGKFPNASQINKIFSKNRSLRVIIEDPTYFNLYPYRVQKDEAKSILASIRNKNQPQWHVGLKIQIVYAIGEADVRWLKNGQAIDNKPKHKETKSAKASVASAKASDKASAKSQSASYSFMASIKNSMQVDRANFSASARFAMRSHDKTASQLSTESKRFVSSEASEAKSLIDSRADSSLSHSIASSDANQFNDLSHPMFQAPGMMQGDFMANVNMSQGNSASSASASASQSASKSASLSASKSQSQSTSASKATSLSESASLSQSVSALSAKSEAAKKSKSASTAKASASKAKSASSKASSASASKASLASAKASKASSASASKKASSASAVASKSSAQKSKASSVASSKASSASASKSASASATKSMEAQQAKRVKESNEKLKRAEELKRKNQAPDTISTVKTFLHDHKLHHGKTQNDRIMDAYEKLLKHKNNHATHWDRAGLNKIYKMEGWNGFFKKNEQDAVTKINQSVDQILTSPAVTYPLTYNVLPNIHMIQQMASAQSRGKSSIKRDQDRSRQYATQKRSSYKPNINHSYDSTSRMSKLRSERHASNGGFNYKSFINQDDKLADSGSTSSKSYSQAPNSSAKPKPKSNVKRSKLPHTLTPYK